MPDTVTPPDGPWWGPLLAWGLFWCIAAGYVLLTLAAQSWGMEA